MTIYYDDMVLAGTVYRPPPFGQNEAGFADDMVYVAPFIEVAVVVVQPPLLNLFVDRIRSRNTQRGRIHPFEQHDEYGILVATQGLAPARRTRIEPFSESELWPGLRTHSRFRATLAGTHLDELGSLAAKRGLPSKEFLTLFLTELS